MEVSQAKELCGKHRKRILPLRGVLGRVIRTKLSDQRKRKSDSGDLTSHNRRSERVSSVGAILSTVPEVPHVKDASSYWRRLQNDPAFAAQMTERQRRIGQWPR